MFPRKQSWNVAQWGPGDWMGDIRWLVDVDVLPKEEGRRELAAKSMEIFA